MMARPHNRIPWSQAVASALAVVLLAASAGCVKSRCTRNSECASGLVCITEIGACRAAECLTDPQCPDGSVCKAYACVPGCRTRADCAAGNECFDSRCVPLAEACDCPTASRFCGTDRNPASPSGGKDVCVPEDRPDGVLLFFGSLGCSHCRAIFDELVALRAEAGTTARLAFVQLGDLVVDPAEVASVLGKDASTVIQDTPQHSIWDAYAADWYHAVLVDRNGCLANHWGPLAGSDVSGLLHDAILDAWKAATAAPCEPKPVEPVPDTPIPDAPATSERAPETMPEAAAEPVPEPVPEAAAEPVPEAVAEPVPDDGPTLPETAEPAPEDAPEPAPEPVPETMSEPVPEPVPDVIDAAVADVADVQDPFTLGPVCQVAPGGPATAGQKVAHFLCADANTSSTGHGTGVSDWLLAEIVWIAYFGACT